MSKNTKENPRKAAPIRYLQDIFDLAGSSTKLAAQLDLHAYTVENWKRSGVPQRWWDKLFELYGITPAELYSISKACRARIVNPKTIR